MRNVDLLTLVVMVGDLNQVSAQEPPPLSVSLGYQALRLAEPPCDCQWTWYPIGVNVDAAFPIDGPWLAIGELAWGRHPFTEDPIRHVGGMNASSAGGGVRWHKLRVRAPSAFAQVLAGIHRDSADGGTGPGLLTFVDPDLPAASFMVQPGVGLFHPVSAAWGVLGQIDYRWVAADRSNHDLRVVAGVRLTRR